jgi:hypothetical protein
MKTTTAEAATEANVTVATIRTWCRTGVVTAVKQAGRWIIDTASLAHRLAIAAMKTAARAPKKVAWTIETMTAIGGRLWERNGMRRVYLNNWAALAGLETSRYNTGNIASASYKGEGISNSQASKLAGCIDKVWFDAADGKLYCRPGYTESRVATFAEVWDDVATGIRTALAAL